VFPNKYLQFWPSKNCVFVRGNVLEAGNEFIDPTVFCARKCPRDWERVDGPKIRSFFSLKMSCDSELNVLTDSNEGSDIGHLKEFC